MQKGVSPHVCGVGVRVVEHSQLAELQSKCLYGAKQQLYYSLKEVRLPLKNHLNRTIS
jgi:hypothetical protein